MTTSVLVIDDDPAFRELAVRMLEGRYAVVDLAGRYFLDAQRRHRFNVRLENLFDEDYATGHGRAFPDAGGAPYLTSTLGVPRTLHVSYTFAY